MSKKERDCMKKFLSITLTSLLTLQAQSTRPILMRGDVEQTQENAPSSIQLTNKTNNDVFVIFQGSQNNRPVTIEKILPAQKTSLGLSGINNITASFWLSKKQYEKLKKNYAKKYPDCTQPSCYSIQSFNIENNKKYLISSQGNGLAITEITPQCQITNTTKNILYFSTDQNQWGSIEPKQTLIVPFNDPMLYVSSSTITPMPLEKSQHYNLEENGISLVGPMTKK